jgi:hypothetical protein
MLALVALAAEAAMEPLRADTPSAGTDITVTGIAVPVCLLGTPTPGGGSNATYAMNTITMTQFIDPSSAKVMEAAMPLEISNAMCNYNAWLSLGSKNGGMTSDNASQVTSGDFLTVVPYTVVAHWGGLDVTLDTTLGKVAKAQAAGANAGSMTLNFSTQNSTTPVVQGTYKDIVTVKVGASL